MPLLFWPAKAKLVLGGFSIAVSAVLAAPVTITAVVPPGAAATDFCIGASGDPNDTGISFGTEIVDDYNITPADTFPVLGIPGQSFLSSQRIAYGSIGWVHQDHKEEICFYFPNDPLPAGEEFTVIIDVLFIDGSDPHADTGLASEGEFSYPGGIFSQLLPAPTMVGVDPALFDRFERLAPVRVGFVNDRLLTVQTIPEPASVWLAVLALSGMWAGRARVLSAPEPSSHAA